MSIDKYVLLFSGDVCIFYAFEFVVHLSLYRDSPCQVANSEADNATTVLYSISLYNLYYKKFNLAFLYIIMMRSLVFSLLANNDNSDLLYNFACCLSLRPFYFILFKLSINFVFSMRFICNLHHYLCVTVHWYLFSSLCLCIWSTVLGGCDLRHLADV
jgi:hypothetical protein